jgi:ABC-type transport system involved in multi-copper enzyme maturation permease subunit
MHFGSLWAITINTFRETVRDRVLYAFIFFAIVVTLAGMLLGSLSVSQNVRVIEDIGMFTISTIGGVIAIFVGTNLVYKELDKRTIYLIFTKPIARWQFIVGKFLGLALCILIVTALMGGFLIATVYMTDPGAFMKGGTRLMPMIGSLGLIYLELLLVIALATFFSTFATPLMSVLFTLGLWFCGHLGQSLVALSNMSDNQSMKPLFDVVYYALPDLAKLTQIRFDLLSQTPHFSTETIVLIAAYVFAYIVILLSFGTLVTERREFS